MKGTGFHSITHSTSTLPTFVLCVTGCMRQQDRAVDCVEVVYCTRHPAKGHGIQAPGLATPCQRRPVQCAQGHDTDGLMLKCILLDVEGAWSYRNPRNKLAVCGPAQSLQMYKCDKCLHSLTLSSPPLHSLSPSFLPLPSPSIFFLFPVLLFFIISYPETKFTFCLALV